MVAEQFLKQYRMLFLVGIALAGCKTSVEPHADRQKDQGSADSRGSELPQLDNPSTLPNDFFNQGPNQGQQHQGNNPNIPNPLNPTPNPYAPDNERDSGNKGILGWFKDKFGSGSPLREIPPAEPLDLNTECIILQGVTDEQRQIIQGWCGIEKRIFELTNALRIQEGKSALVFDPKISLVSRDWSYEQSRVGEISHKGGLSARMAVYEQAFGSRQPLNGENVAMFAGYSTEPEAVAQQFFKQWRTSTGHYRNMIGNHGKLGVGIWMVGRQAYATQLFAR